MSKAADCHQCKYYNPLLMYVCAKGHSPRFFVPKTIMQAHLGNYGWRRKCKDFDQTKRDL